MVNQAHPSTLGHATIRHATIRHAPARDILTRATGFIGAYDFTLNPYSGCTFGCAYCYAAFFNRTAEDRDSWGYWVRVKSNAVELLQRRLRRTPDYLDDKAIYMSSVTDPYQPIERKARITRGILEVMAGTRVADGDQSTLLNESDAQSAPPAPKPRLVIQTRSPDVVRDCDLFRRIEANGGRVRVNMTVTTDDEDIRRVFEPHCPSNPARLRAIAQVQAGGIDTCITLTPLLLVSDAHAFADSLLATGATRFVIQSFHFGRGKFVASTRDEAFDLMAQKLNTDRATFLDKYLSHYQRVHHILRHSLPNLSEGKQGFAPPP